MCGKRWVIAWVLGVLVAAFSGASRGAEHVVEVVRLHHRSAEQVLPLIVPIAAPGTVTGTGSDLVIRTTRSNLAEVKKVIAQLDRAPRRLNVTVRQDAGDDANGQGSATRTFSTRSADSDRSVQRVQVDDGRSAYIYVGQLVPVVLRRGGRSAREGGREVDDPVVMIRETVSGFVVRPRVQGELVSLDIEPRHDVPGAQGRGSVELQRVATTVSGRIGTWIELAGVLAVDATSADGTSYSTRSVTTRPRRILVRVDALEP